MDSVLQEAAKQVPALAVLSWVVWFFLKHIATEREAFRIALEKIEGRSHSMVREAIALLHDNTTQMEKLKTGLRQIADLWDSDLVIDPDKADKVLRRLKERLQIRVHEAGHPADAGS